MRQRDLKWKEKKLYNKDQLLVELIPHEVYPKMYHLKFCWREDKTPEFFNIINAKENTRIYAAQHFQYDVVCSLYEPRGEV